MLVPEFDEFVDEVVVTIKSTIASTVDELKARLSAIEAKSPVCGPGVSSLLISADGRLIAHLTDGRTLDVGPVPVKDGAPGADGRDADPARLRALELEVASLKSELAAKQEDMEELRASVVGLDQVQGLIDIAGEKLMTGLPPAPAGQDGKSVSVEDVAPLIVAEVQRVAATLPVPKDGRDGQDGQSVVLEDVAPLIVAEVKAAVAALPVPQDGQDGRSVDVSDIAPLIALEVEKAVAALPLAKDGQDGQSVSLNDVRPLIAAEVEKSVAALPSPKDGAPGASVTVEDVTPVIVAEVQKLVSAIPAPRDGVDGKSVDAADVEALVALHVEKAVGSLTPARDGKDGKSVTVDDVAPLIVAEVQKATALIPAGKDGEPGRAGTDGKTVTVDDVAPLIVAEVQKATALIPAGKDGEPGRAGTDGKTVTVDDVAPLIVAEVTKAVASISVPKDGRDGVGVFGALIDRSGHLVLTLSDGTAKDLGPVVGKDVDVEAVEQLILSEVAKIPVPKDGAPGKDGRDGFGFDDLDLVSDDRGVFLRFVRGDVTKEFRLPVVVDRGVFSEGRTYGKGDGVTWGGSFWIAQDETTMKPDFTPAAAKHWRLAVKEGRRGKDADPAAVEALVAKAVAKIPRSKAPEATKW